VQRLAAVALVLLAGCENARRTAPDATIADAVATDDAVPPNPGATCFPSGSAAPRQPELVAAIDDSLVPFTTTGTTPAGSLDDIRYLGISFLGGDCLPAYNLVLYRSIESGSNTYPDAVVFVAIPFPFTELSPGTVAAHAWLYSDYDGTCTDEVRFEVVHLDPPQDGPMRIAGRVVANDGAWNLDFSIDATAVPINCI
jgi:hypothetical protein